MESQNTEWKESCRAEGTPLPTLNHKGVDLWTEFAFSAEYLAAIRDTNAKSQTEPRLDERLDEKLGEKLGETRSAIIRHMLESPKITVTELGERLSISRNGIDKNIQIPKRNGYIRRIGPAKGGRWEVNLDPPSESR
jgi:predicted HTH transcriptional regulator